VLGFRVVRCDEKEQYVHVEGCAGVALSVRTLQPPTGPLCTPFGETQTLEARAAFVRPSCLLAALRVRRSTA
jgi:hypothetical protein